MSDQEIGDIIQEEEDLNLDIIELEEEVLIEEPQKKKSKKIKKLFLALFLFFIFFSWYSYYVWITISRDSDNFMTTLTNGYKNIFAILKGESKDINYEFFLEWNFEEIKWWNVQNSWEINISDGTIISTDWGLKQRLKLWEVNWNINLEHYRWTEKKEFLIKNFDILSSNEKLYFFIEEWIGSLKEFFSDDENIISNLNISEKSFDNWEYIMIDNSKPLLKLFWELAKDAILKEILIGLVTSNPSSYYTQNWIDKKIGKYIMSDKIIDYLFIEWEKDIETDRSTLSLNNNICNDYAPIISELYIELWLVDWVLSIDWMTQNCNNQIELINGILPMVTQIYKEWDSETGNFTLKIVQWNLLDINIDYKNHYVNTWYASLTSAIEQYDFSINWKNNKVLSSSLKLDIDNSWLVINWEIIDWNWKFIFESELRDEMNIKWEINISKYKIWNYDIAWSWNYMWINSVFDAKWTLIDWIINFKTLDEGGIISKLFFEYDETSFNLDLLFDNIDIKSSYSSWKFILQYTEEWYDWELQTDLWLEYSEWNVKWNIITNWAEAELEWKIVSEEDFNFKIEWWENELTFDAFGTDEWNINYSLVWKTSGKKMWECVLVIVKSIVDGYDISDISFEANMWDNDNITDWYKANFKIWLKENGGVYEVPENISEVDISLNEIFMLPDFLTINNSGFNNKSLIVWWTVAWSVIWTASYISLHWYTIDAMNTKRLSDISTLSSVISSKQAEWVSLKSMIVRKQKYEWSRIIIWWRDITQWEEYFVWTPNYSVLGITKDDLKDPDGIEYLIWIIEGEKEAYQILWKLEKQSWIKTALVYWTYSPENIIIFKEWKDYEKVSDKRIILEKKYIDVLKEWYVINWLTITEVSKDWMTITFDKKIEKSTLFLPADTQWLIFIDEKVIKNDDLFNY